MFYILPTYICSEHIPLLNYTNFKAVSGDMLKTMERMTIIEVFLKC